MFIAALFTIARTIEATKASIYRGMDKEDVAHIYTMDYYAAIKVKVAQSCLLFATPWTIQSMEFSRSEYWSG